MGFNSFLAKREAIFSFTIPAVSRYTATVRYSSNKYQIKISPKYPGLLVKPIITCSVGNLGVFYRNEIADC
jgi:hypothetical protein